jgi:hypothetical protein
MDSDGQHCVKDLENLISVIKQKKIDMVIGYRNYKKIPFIRSLGTIVLKKISKVLFKINLQDVQSGMRIFKKNIYNKIKWNSAGSEHYFADAEISSKLFLKNIKYRDIPIKTIFIDKYKGMNLFQGIHLLICMIIWKLNS